MKMIPRSLRRTAQPCVSHQTTRTAILGRRTSLSLAEDDGRLDDSLTVEDSLSVTELAEERVSLTLLSATELETSSSSMSAGSAAAPTVPPGPGAPKGGRS